VLWSPDEPGTTPRSHSNPIWFENLPGGKTPALILFCFPYAGASTHVFRHWRQYFPPRVDVCLVHVPGRGRRAKEPPFTRLNLLVDAIADHIGSELRHPFAFYGHSMGAMISFELARELRRRCGIEPVELFLSGRPAPHVVRSKPITFNLPDDELITILRKLNGTLHELLEDSEITEFFLPALRADFEIVDTYECRPEPRLSCPITVYGGLQDKIAPVADLLAWKELTLAAFKVRLFPGDHFFIHAANAEFLEAFRLDISDTFCDSPGQVLST
jgi:medium-chain acyl-[acyl-carrier-protein] hydrolase